MISVTKTIKVPFKDIDSWKLIWFGNIFNYFDMIRTDLLNKVSYDITDMENEKKIWPVVDAQCKYFGVIEYKDKLVIKASLIQIKYKLEIKYQVYKKKKLVALGKTVQVPCDINTRKINIKKKNAIQKKYKSFQ
jgi:acyl-CoA thioester hydrolase